MSYDSTPWRCQHCGKPVTWTERRWALSRLRSGAHYSNQELRQFDPGCRKCAAQVVHTLVMEKRQCHTKIPATP
jgi:hypothetical protein